MGIYQSMTKIHRCKLWSSVSSFKNGRWKEENKFKRTEQSVKDNLNDHGIELELDGTKNVQG